MFVIRFTNELKQTDMKIKKIVLMAIRGNTELRRRLKEVLGNISEPTFGRMLNENRDDLTKAAALKVIREETGLSDSEILEEGSLEEAKS
jgi:hypothetical protein